MQNIDIKVKLKDYRPHTGIKRGMIQLVCSGNDANVQFLNGLGRIAVKRLPTYAFAKELIKIERIDPESGYRDSVPFNHDMMRNRIMNIPVMNVDPGFSFLHEKYWKNVDYEDESREKHEMEKRIEMYVDAKNTANEDDHDAMVRVTTNDVKIYIDDELTQIYDQEYPLLIIDLRAREAFKCSARAVLGLGLQHSSWDACSNYCHDQETIPGKTIMKLQASSRFDEFTLISRALEYYKIRSKMIKDEIARLYLLKEDHSTKFKVVLKDEDHTMGEAINFEIQSHPNILKSSCAKPSHLSRTVELEIVAFDKKNLISSVMESIDHLLDKIEQFGIEFRKIKKPSNDNIPSTNDNLSKSKQTKSSKSSKSKKSKSSKSSKSKKR